LIRSAFTIVKHHEIIIIYLLSYNLLPSLLDDVEGVIFEGKVKAWGWEEVEVRTRVLLFKVPPVLPITEATALGVSTRPKHAGRMTFSGKKFG
jgi:hypothetical protein